MKRKIMMVAVALLMAMSASAQFEQDKIYVGGSLTGLDLSYSGIKEFNVGLQAEGGYFLADDFLVKGIVGYDHSTAHSSSDLALGVGARYYIEQNGIFLGLNAKYVHNSNYNLDDFRPGIEIGYAYFLSRTVTIEPSVYYDQSFKNHSDFSTFGLKVGLGIYLFR
ncbi:MAG: outer membrane beta-barrel protein [Prevotella sp.]|nr:outer membrane beta-barrel protein [Prevotella sp.]